jgi:hypothetical protein
MTETLVALTLAHLLADFVFQTAWIVKNKWRAPALLAHTAIVGLVSWACLGFAPAFLALTLVALSHAVIDAIKVRWGGPGLKAFLLDQSAHGAMILAASLIAPEAFHQGLWKNPALAAHDLLVPTTMTIAAGLIATVFAGGYAVKALMTSVQLPGPDERLDMPKGGLFIGRLERLLIFMIAIGGHTEAIGFLIAAKSILRFNELSRERDRQVSEYVIIGTLASFAWGIAAAQATVYVLARLLPASP